MTDVRTMKKKDTLKVCIRKKEEGYFIVQISRIKLTFWDQHKFYKTSCRLRWTGGSLLCLALLMKKYRLLIISVRTSMRLSNTTTEVGGRWLDTWTSHSISPPPLKMVVLMLLVAMHPEWRHKLQTTTLKWCKLHHIHCVFGSIYDLWQQTHTSIIYSPYLNFF